MLLIGRLLIGLLNVGLVLVTIFQNGPDLIVNRSPIASSIGVLIGMSPLIGTAWYALLKRPRWMWAVAMVGNVLMLVVGMGMGISGVAKSDAGLLSLGAMVGVLPMLNVAFLLWRQPSKPPETAPRQSMEIAE